MTAHLSKPIEISALEGILIEMQGRKSMTDDRVSPARRFLVPIPKKACLSAGFSVQVSECRYSAKSASMLPGGRSPVPAGLCKISRAS